MRNSICEDCSLSLTKKSRRKLRRPFCQRIRLRVLGSVAVDGEVVVSVVPPVMSSRMPSIMPVDSVGLVVGRVVSWVAVGVGLGLVVSVMMPLGLVLTLRSVQPQPVNIPSSPIRQNAVAKNRFMVLPPVKMLTGIVFRGAQNLHLWFAPSVGKKM